MSDVFLVALVALIALVFAWPLTFGRRYFRGERKQWPQIRRDLFSGSLDEGIYPLDPPRDDDSRTGDDRPR